MSKIIIDLEFTGLDNSFICDNEIIQLKMKNLDNGKCVLQNYRSNKPLSAHVQLEHKTKCYSENYLFSPDKWIAALCAIDAVPGDEFFGFGVQMDIAMLKKYGIDIQITDIRTWMQLTPEFEYRMATEGSGLEECYLIATGHIPAITDHAGMDELFIIEKLYRYASVMNRGSYLTLMPHGHCAGMPISDYVQQYRRQADGYRYNNVDILADSLDHAINEMEYAEEEEK